MSTRARKERGRGSRGSRETYSPYVDVFSFYFDLVVLLLVRPTSRKLCVCFRPLHVNYIRTCRLLTTPDCYLSGVNTYMSKRCYLFLTHLQCYLFEKGGKKNLLLSPRAVVCRHLTSNTNQKS